MSGTASARVAQLDGLRGTAIGLVVLFHYSSANRILWSAASWGWTGVDLFFVMSGFLIGGIVVDNRNASNFYPVFYLRRFLRIFPIYYLLLAAVAIFVWLGWLPRPDRESLVFYVFHLQNIVTALTHDYGLVWLQVTWSLAVEEHFYLLLPVLAAAIPPRFLGHALVAGVLIAIFSRIPAYAIPVDYPRDFARFFTFCRMDDLFYGVLLALAVRNESMASFIREHRFGLYLGCGLLVLAIIAASRLDAQLQNEVMLSTVGLTLLGPLFACIVALAVVHQDSWVSSLMKQPVLGWVGRRAYAIYLFHVPAIDGIQHAFRHFGFQHFGIWLASCALAVTIAAATLSWRLIEAPLIRYGHRHKYTFGRLEEGLALGNA